MVLNTRCQDSLLSLRRVHVVFSIDGFKGGGKPCPKTRETPALLGGIQKASRTKLGSNTIWLTRECFIPKSKTNIIRMHHRYLVIPYFSSKGLMKYKRLWIIECRM